MLKHYFRHANIQPEGTCSLIYPLWALHQTTVFFTHSPGVLNSEWIPKNIKLVEPVKGCSGCCLRFKSERTKSFNASFHNGVPKKYSLKRMGCYVLGHIVLDVSRKHGAFTSAVKQFASWMA